MSQRADGYNMAFCIITDSASDIPDKVIEEYGLHVIPTPVTLDGEDYFDGETLKPDEFYKIQKEDKVDIKTYHISQYMFYEQFKLYAERGDEVLYICFSSGIAGTFQAAKLAEEDVLEEYPEFKITIIDSKCASLGLGLVVYKLLRMQRNGADKEMIIEAAEHFCGHMEHVFTVNTLEYLARGGRLSRTSAAMGGVLDIKPIIIVNKDGALEAVEKVRGMKKTVKRCIEMTKEKGVSLDRQIVGVVYGANPEDAEPLVTVLKEDLSVREILLGQVGCAIGAHTGPGITGMVFENAEDGKYGEYL